MKLNKKFIYLITAATITILGVTVYWWLSNYGFLDLTVSPPGAIIKIDEKVAPSSKVKLRVGKHNINISKSSFEPYSKEITIKRGKTERLSVALATAAEAKMRKLLPRDTADYKIEFTNDKYIISLYAILNNDHQLASYKQELAQYKKEALSWIKSMGVDPTTLKIEWLPEEAVDY